MNKGYQCEFCTRFSSDKSWMKSHEEKCPMNPENTTCYTCKYYREDPLLGNGFCDKAHNDDLQEKFTCEEWVKDIGDELMIKKYLLSCPGDTLLEHIQYIKIDKETLSKQLDLSISELQELIEGRMILSDELAEKLEAALDISKSFWINREKSYRKELAEIEELEKSLKQ